MSSPFQNMYPNLRTFQEQLTKMFGGGFGFGGPGGIGGSGKTGAGSDSSGPFGNWPFAGGMPGNWTDLIANMAGTGNGAFSGSGDIPVDVYEYGDGLMVVAEIPGLTDAHDVTLNVSPEQLVISGKIERGYSQSGGTLHVSERRIGSFERSIDLPIRVKRSGARARYQNGLLEVHLLKSARPQTDPGSSIPIDFHA
ncbi:Hsp20/alpha crystallin family protein [Alicyclobacillus mengziensis]|uniref:Hsp20/alpha crystallin family protein n=1 Tax=Alicyclobacillus mengziensis TaxID=2931921 RepID=A0A9X7VWI1_9BACL|nr:Hsp20/alpha crystallin family protein [Alicyclobacillus mengziensis]QSO45807.1 Hsp20/alpha crystallin family protein [Alicyclobacillus mengziensis]